MANSQGGVQGRLLPTKWQPPRQRPTLVERPLLVRRIEAGLWRRLTLVSAPAGFGKTTLVVAWARATRARVAWLSLEPRDDCPGRLLAYLAGALRTIRPSLAPGVEALLERGDHVDFRALLEEFILTPLADEAEPFVLVLDDLHELSGEVTLSGLAELIERLPASMHIVVTTRESPPWPLSQWGARDNVTHVGAEELRFNRHETGLFIREIMKLELSTDEVDALFGQAEGWAAATQLLAAAVARQPGAVRAAPPTESVGAYLLDEVFSLLEATRQRHLLALSVVDTLTARTARDLAGVEDGAALLVALDRGNLLLRRLGGEADEWRLYALFRDWLRRRLEGVEPLELKRLHGVAARSLAEQGRVEAALLHARLAGDDDLLASLVERFGLEAIYRSNLEPVGQWLEAVAPAIRRRRPWLTILEAWFRLLSNAPAQLAVVPALLRRLSGLEEEPVLTGHCLALRCLLELDRQDLHHALAQVTHAIEAVGEFDELPLSVLHLNAGTLATILGDDQAALLHLATAKAAARQAGNVFVTVASLAALGNTLAALGRLDELGVLVDSALDYAERERCDEFGLGGYLYLLRAVLLFERWELEAALAAADAAWSRARPLADPYVLGSAARLRFRCARALARADEKERARSDLKRLAATSRFPMAQVWLSAVSLQVQLDAGGLDGVGGAVRVEAIQPLAERHELNRVELAYARRRGGSTRALARLLLDTSTAAGRLGEALDWHVALALAEATEGDVSAAAKTLGEAVVLARAQTHRRPFAETASEWSPWLGELRAEAREWLRACLPVQARQRVARSEPALVTDATGALLERPTQRELEVLALVAVGWSNAEVSKQLFVSLGTIKTHLHRLYEKLGARNRVEAVRKARELGLIATCPPG